MKQLTAEFLGSFWLVLGGCGCAILAVNGGTNGIGPLGVSLAFGFAVMTAALAFGSYSGGHFNPAVSIGVATAGRFPWSRVPAYVVAQVLGMTFAALALYLVASSHSTFDLSAGFAANGYGAHSPGGFSLPAAFLMESICTGLFIFVILAVTHPATNAALAPLGVGVMLAVIHLILIPVTNASVNPARSLSQALIVGDWALAQLWLFWVAPIAGAVLGAMLYRKLQIKV